MSYYISKILPEPFETAVERIEAALQKEGFGVITRIDIQETLRKKIGVEFRPYVILGACNPELAYQALQIEDKVGTMLPCNVVVQSIDDGRTEIAAINPVASMMAIDNADLVTAAGEARNRLSRAVESL